MGAWLDRGSAWAGCALRHVQRCEGENDGKSEYCSVREADPLMRRGLALAALVVPSLLGAGIAAPAALAADDCPNAAVRAQQSATRLPNCLAFERVSPADKNGATPGAAVATADGDRVLSAMNSGLADNQGFLNGNYRLSRTADGWKTTALSPPFTGLTPALGDLSDPVLWSDDLERVVIPMLYAISPNDQGRIVGRGGSTGSADVYLRESDGSFTWIAPDPSVVDSSTSPVRAVGASRDLDRVVVTTMRKFDPQVTTTDLSQVYLWTRSGTRLVSVLPNGDPATNPPPQPDPAQPITAVAVSADGRRVAFTDGQWGDERLYVRYNADDPATAVTREVAVGPNGERCTTSGITQMIAFSADGTKMLFGCSTAILPGAPANGVYLRDLDGGPGAVQLVGPRRNSRFFGGNADFSRFYMSGVGDDGSVVLVRDGVRKKIATGTRRVEGEQDTFNSVAVSPDGQYVTFQGVEDYDVPGTDLGPPGTDPGTDPSRSQVYVYSAPADELRCVSCRPDGSPTEGRAFLEPGVGYTGVGKMITPVADNGAATFSTDTALDPADTNGVQDAYAWTGGRPLLLSSGRNASASASNGTTRGGTVFIFATGDSLVPDDRDGGSYDTYVAREGGGFLVPDAPADCTTSCQAPGAERPGLPGLGSVDLLGSGNLVERDPSATASRATAALTVSRSVRGTSTSVRVKVSRAGSIRVSGVGLRQTTVNAKKAGTYRVTARLSTHGVKQQRSRGRLATRVTARFTPASGASVTTRKSVTFTAKKGGR